MSRLLEKISGASARLLAALADSDGLVGYKRNELTGVIKYFGDGGTLFVDAYASAASLLRTTASNAAMYVPTPDDARQNTDGSGLVSNGSAIGLIRDRVHGMSSMSQSTSSKKPSAVLSDGRYRIHFDGTDDVLVAPASPTLSEGLVQVWAGRLNVNIDGARFFGCTNGSTNTFALEVFGDSSGKIVVEQKNGFESGIACSVDIQTGIDVVISVVRTASGHKVRMNSGAWVYAADSGAAADPAITPAAGARSDSAAPSNSDLCYYAYGNFGAYATDDNVRVLEEAAAKAAGVTLP